MVKRYNKSNTDENIKNPKQFLNESTNVLLSIKTLLLVVGFIFVVVFGFYRLVIEPKLLDLDKRYYLIHNDQKVMYSQIIAVNNNIMALKSSIDKTRISSDGTMLQDGTLLPDGSPLPNSPSSYYIYDKKGNQIQDSVFIINEETQTHYNFQKTYAFYEDFVHNESNLLQVPLRD